MFFCIFRGDLRNCEVQPYACGCKGNGSLIYVFSIKPALNIYNIVIKQIQYEYIIEMKPQIIKIWMCYKSENRVIKEEMLRKSSKFILSLINNL